MRHGETRSAWLREVHRFTRLLRRAGLGIETLLVAPCPSPQESSPAITHFRFGSRTHHPPYNGYPL
jgi:hypothetical protein